jgi:hypothetical protein
VLALCAILLTGACTSLSDRHGLSGEAAACTAQFEDLDRRVRGAGAADGAAYRIPEFPWLRLTRFLASFRDELPDGSREWLEHLRQTDLEARRYEIANLERPPAQHRVISDELKRLDRCGRLLNQHLTDGHGQLRLQRAAAVPDDYHTAMRWLGLYPITQMFVLPGVQRLHRTQHAALAAIPEVAPGRASREYHALGQASQHSQARASQAAAKARRDAIGVPMLTPHLEASLLDRYAPVWRMETAGYSDRIGAPVWLDRSRPSVDVRRPTEYRFVSFARFGNDVLVQLNYLVWFPERPRRSAIDLFSGHIDGALWRITLDRNGDVFAAESVHACGCYYMVFPGAGLAPSEAQPRGEPIFAGGSLVSPLPGQRIRLTREAETHFLVHVDIVDGASSHRRVPLATRHASELRSMLHPDGRRGLYRPDGIVPGSQRLERWLLWPMGVPSAGAKRQPGRHPIAFVGRRHFDDPRLLERHFERTAGAP